jgi:murein endopeptidase
MAGMLEWTGRQIAQKYSSSEYKDLHLLLGDISAPRGGCLSGRGGRRGHKSHTTGQDVDVGYLTPRENQASPEGFHRGFDAKTNWWLIKELFKNPYACVKVIFLDRRNIKALSKVAWGDPDWKTFGRYIRHVPGHRDHMHVRIGDGPGKPGCAANTDQEIEDQLDGEEEEASVQRKTLERQVSER